MTELSKRLLMVRGSRVQTPRLVHFDFDGDWMLNVVMVIRRMMIVRLRWLWV